jgi:hypothetical protein
METETPINEQQGLQIIEEMIQRVKGNLRDNSFMYLLWGWLVLVASLGNYVLQFVIQFDKPWICWAVLMPLGGIISSFYGRKEAKQEKVKTYVSEFLGYLVIAFLVGLFTVLFFMSFLKENCYPMVMLMYGIWLFVSGGALQFRPLIIGGMINWALAIGAFFVPFQYQLLLLSAAVLLGYIIPGHLLSHQFSSKTGNTGAKRNII